MCIAIVSNTCWYLVNFRLNLMLALQAASHTVMAVASDDRLYTKARQAHPARWSGPTRNWSALGHVTLNPERDSVVSTDSRNNDIQPLAA